MELELGVHGVCCVACVCIVRPGALVHHPRRPDALCTRGHAHPGFARLVTLDPAAGDHIPPAAVAAAVAPAHVRLHQFGVLPRVAGDHAVARSLIVEAVRCEVLWLNVGVAWCPVRCVGLAPVLSTIAQVGGKGV
jgi:hypothetical protein